MQPLDKEPVLSAGKHAIAAKLGKIRFFVKGGKAETLLSLAVIWPRKRRVLIVQPIYHYSFPLFTYTDFTSS